MKAHLRMSLFLASLAVFLSNADVWAHTDVTVEQARDLIASTEDLIVVDVREPVEFCDEVGHIPGAANYPWTSEVLQARYEELPAEALILVVCRSGNRSNQASDFLDSKGFWNVFDMLGGMKAWTWETAPCRYSGGSGTAFAPYQIATAADVIALGETPEDYDKHFILTADIDLDPNLPGGRVFDRAVIAPDTNDAEPLFQGMPFHGVFDGNDHTIANLTIAGASHLGLFGATTSGAYITRLRVEAADVNGTGTHIGALVGGSATVGGGAHIAASYSTGVIRGLAIVGGLVGLQSRGSQITTSHSMATVQGSDYIGGLAGVNFGSLTNCYAGGHVTGHESIGGLAGQNGDLGRGSNDYAIIAHCYSSCRVSGDGQAVGGLVGVHDYGEIAASFWDIDASGQTAGSGETGPSAADSDQGLGLSTGEMKTAGTFVDAGWDFGGETVNGTEDIWWIDEGKDYPRLWWEREGIAPATVTELNAENFDAEIAAGVILVEFYASWCPACVAQGPILDEVAERLGDQARVAKLDADQARDIALRYEVWAIPTLVVFCEGVPSAEFVGTTDADTLVDAVLRIVESQA